MARQLDPISGMPVDSCAGEANEGKSRVAENGHVHMVEDLGRQFGELKDYAAYFLAAKADRIKLTLRNLGLYAALGAVGAIAGAALIITATVLLVQGLAQLINKPLPYALQPWLGNLLVGLLLLGLVGGGVYWTMNKVFGASRKRTVQKYENRRRQQSINYGHNVSERAEQP